MNIYYTYLYTDPSRNERIYVGKGKGKRAYAHQYRTNRHPFTHRLNKMREEGVEPIITFLCKDADEEFALFVEEEAIALWGRKDLGKGTLLNLTHGGEGPTGYVMSEETKKRLSDLGKLRKPSAETKAKTSKALKGRKKPPISDATRQILSRAQKGKKQNPEHIVNRLAAMNTPKYSENMSKSIKGLKHFHNGVIAIRARECPEGFVPGQLWRKK